MYKIKLADVNKDTDFSKYDINISGGDSSLLYDGKHVVFTDEAICPDVNEESLSILYSVYNRNHRVRT